MNKDLGCLHRGGAISAAVYHWGNCQVQPRTLELSESPGGWDHKKHLEITQRSMGIPPKKNMLFMAIYGYLWLFMVTYGYSMLFMINSGY